MPIKLTTTISKISSIANSVNSELIHDFHEYMKNNGASECHQNNNLKVIIAYAKFLGPDISLYNVQKKEQIISFLDTKIKNPEVDPDKKWITTWKPILFRIPKRTKPQQFFPNSLRADIMEDLNKRKNVLIEPTEVNLSKGRLSSSSKYSVSNSLEYQKAQSFLDVLTQLPFVPLYIHKLQLSLSVDKQFYKELAQKEGHINRAKRHEEIIGRRHVIYTFLPNGTVEIGVKSSDTPFKVETDEDEIVIFSFFGQVRDRLLYHVSDIKERHIPDIMAWILKACDLNRDVMTSIISHMIKILSTNF